MIIQKVICDHCGKEIDVSNDQTDFGHNLYINWYVKLTREGKEFQLCNDCKKEIEKFLHANFD